MCTLTWTRDPSNGLEVFFNRDELKTRPIADPPSLHESGDSFFLSPLDPKGGGTWMLANDQGLVVCLLNKWELEGRKITLPRSRGRLVWKMASAGSPDEVGEFLMKLENYQAFTLAAFSPLGTRCWEWDGEQLLSKDVPPFLTSSSYKFEEVRASREACFSTGVTGAEFHASPWEPPSAYSVRMNRPDAQTWSRSRVRVTDRVSWEYLSERPGLIGEPVKTVVELPLR